MGIVFISEHSFFFCDTKFNSHFHASYLCGMFYLDWQDSGTFFCWNMTRNLLSYRIMYWYSHYSSTIIFCLGFRNKIVCDINGSLDWVVVTFSVKTVIFWHNNLGLQVCLESKLRYDPIKAQKIRSAMSFFSVLP